MPLDPQARPILAALKRLPPLEALAVSSLRSRLTESFRTKGVPEPLFRVDNRQIPGEDEEPLAIRIYTPSARISLPVLVYFHGGGFVANNLETHDALCRGLANGGQCLVVAVDYRLAPEHKYPAGLNDCYRAARWAVENALGINGDPARVAVGGDSSGGALAAGVALLARDRGEFKLVYQLLIYPVMDYYHPGTSSYEENGYDYSLTKAAMRMLFAHYLPEPFDRHDPYLFPLQARELSALPPALVITAGYDPLRDEGIAYALRLQAAGVSTGLHNYEGMMHGFLMMAGMLDKGKLAMAEIAASLTAAFALG